MTQTTVPDSSKPSTAITGGAVYDNIPSEIHALKRGVRCVTRCTNCGSNNVSALGKQYVGKAYEEKSYMIEVTGQVCRRCNQLIVTQDSYESLSKAYKPTLPVPHTGKSNMIPELMQKAKQMGVPVNITYVEEATVSTPEDMGLPENAEESAPEGKRIYWATPDRPVVKEDPETGLRIPVPDAKVLVVDDQPRNPMDHLSPKAKMRMIQVASAMANLPLP